MSGSSSLADRARRVARSANQAEPAAPEAAAPTGARPAPRTKPVRVTTDLPPQTHRALTRIAAELAETTGHTRVNFTDILRALVAELETSAELQARVAARLVQ